MLSVLKRAKAVHSSHFMCSTNTLDQWGLDGSAGLMKSCCVYRKVEFGSRCALTWMPRALYWPWPWAFTPNSFPYVKKRCCSVRWSFYHTLNVEHLVRNKSNTLHTLFHDLYLCFALKAWIYLYDYQSELFKAVFIDWYHFLSLTGTIIIFISEYSVLIL